MASNHRVTDLEKIPVRISKDEAPTPLSAVGPLFISSLLFHLSRALLGAWRFSLFRSVYSSFHNRLDLIREPAFYWVFYFIFQIYPCLFHPRGAGIAQWLERRTRDRKFAGSNPCWSGGRIFFCADSFRYPFHPRVTAVARKRPRSFCQKRRWQVTAKHAYTLRM